MATLYLTEQYSLVKIEGEALRVQPSGSRPGQVVRVPINKVEQVVILGEVTLTTPALHALMERRIPVHYLTARGRSCGSLVADWGKNSGVRLAQYERKDGGFMLRGPDDPETRNLEDLFGPVF